jgi:hypothetical protein
VANKIRVNPWFNFFYLFSVLSEPALSAVEGFSVAKTNKVVARKIRSGIDLEKRSKNAYGYINNRTIIGICSIIILRGKNKKIFGKSA